MGIDGVKFHPTVLRLRNSTCNCFFGPTLYLLSINLTGHKGHNGSWISFIASDMIWIRKSPVLLRGEATL